MRKLALILTTTTLILSSTACVNSETEKTERESTTQETESTTIDAGEGEESAETSIGKPLNIATTTMETDSGTLTIQLNDADTYKFRELYECVDIVHKDNSDAFSAIYALDEKEYKDYIGAQQDNVKEETLEEITQGHLATTVSTSQTDTSSDVSNVAESETKASWGYIFYKYEDTYDRTHYIYTLNSPDTNLSIVIENVCSEELAADIFNNLWFEIE